MEGHSERLRRAEVEQVKSWFMPGMRVLEIGGGSGYQASILASWGCDVVSIDLPNRDAPEVSYYSVQDYDGVTLPFVSDRFDIIFSSNVLEHIQPLPPMFAEMHRVLKPEGLAIHILPSPAWRLWTSLSYYPHVFKRLTRIFHGQQQPKEGVASTPRETNSSSHPGSLISHVIRQALLIQPHGEYPNALSELYYFSKSRWLRVFRENGFDIEQVTNNQLFYTGYMLFPEIKMETRRTIAHFLGSACQVYIMHHHKYRKGAN
jgi:SAM-dependent methyltransferase